MKKSANFWTKDECAKVALKYDSILNFKNENDYVYVKSYKNG